MAKNKFRNMMLLNQKLFLKGIRIRFANTVDNNNNNNTNTKDNKKTMKHTDKSNKRFNKGNKANMFMAVGKGAESTEGGTFEPKYAVGMADCQVVAVNPTKAELEKLYGREIKNDITYVDEVDRNGMKIKRIRIDFYIKPVEGYVLKDGTPFDKIQKHSYFITNERRFDGSRTKCEVIDEYGNSGWATKDEIEAGSTMFTKKDGSKYYAKISPNYRPTYNGEAAMTEFVRIYLNMPNVLSRNENDGSWFLNDKATSEHACRFDSYEKIFNGDVSEIKEAIAYQPNNKVKVAWGIRTDNEGKLRQVTYPTVLKPFVTDWSKLATEIQDANTRAVNNGRQAEEYLINNELTELREYEVKATAFAQENPVSDNNPFANPSNNPFATSIN